MVSFQTGLSDRIISVLLHPKGQMQTSHAYGPPCRIPMFHTLLPKSRPHVLLWKEFYRFPVPRKVLPSYGCDLCILSPLSYMYLTLIFSQFSTHIFYHTILVSSNFFLIFLHKSMSASFLVQTNF